MKQSVLEKDTFINTFCGVEYAMEWLKLISLNELEALPYAKRHVYFERLMAECKSMCVSKPIWPFVVRTIGRIVPLIRPYDLVIEGEENIPSDTEVIFLCNHSNSHDFFTVDELFYKLKKQVSPIVAWDGLSWFSRLFFRLGNGILIKRDSSESISKGVLNLCSRMLNGTDGFIFGEATWNMHPYKPMQNLHAGVTEISLITGKPIVPVIFEYVESDGICKKETDVYKKCIVSFGKPVTVTADESIFGQTDKLQAIMSSMREMLWNREGVKKSDFSENDVERYINHTYLKKYKAFGFKYNTEWESQFLLTKGQKIENEYCLDEYGNFVPGIVKGNLYG